MLKRLQCRKYQGWITRYLTGDLDPEARVQQFERHIASCDKCKQAVAEKRGLLNELLARNASEEDLQEALAALGLVPRVNRPLGVALSVVLVAALFASAYLWRLANPTDNLLGPKATTMGVGEAKPPMSEPVSNRQAPPPASGGRVADTKAPPAEAVKATPEPPKPSTKPQPKLPRKTAQPAVRRPAPSAVPSKPQPRSEVEILDPSGSVVRRAGSNIPQ
ncbi:MAG: zf-HC2 domain-containing protein [Fimbriimonadia bacterium]|jgi:type IV secretory pathway VirB10-like protein